MRRLIPVLDGMETRDSSGYSRGEIYRLGMGNDNTDDAYCVRRLAGDLQKLLLCSPLRLASLLQVLL